MGVCEGTVVGLKEGVAEVGQLMDLVGWDEGGVVVDGVVEDGDVVIGEEDEGFVVGMGVGDPDGRSVGDFVGPAVDAVGRTLGSIVSNEDGAAVGEVTGGGSGMDWGPLKKFPGSYFALMVRNLAKLAAP